MSLFTYALTSRTVQWNSRWRWGMNMDDMDGYLQLSNLITYQCLNLSKSLLAKDPRRIFSFTGNGPVRLALSRRIKFIPAYMRSGLSVLTAKVPVEWKRDFQNETTNKEFDSKTIFNLVFLKHQNVTPSHKVMLVPQTITWLRKLRSPPMPNSAIFKWPVTSQWLPSRRLSLQVICHIRSHQFP